MLALLLLLRRLLLLVMMVVVEAPTILLLRPSKRDSTWSIGTLLHQGLVIFAAWFRVDRHPTVFTIILRRGERIELVLFGYKF